MQVRGDGDRDRPCPDEDEVDEALREYQNVANFSSLRLHWDFLLGLTRA
jgi:hypothetical protein